MLNICRATVGVNRKCPFVVFVLILLSAVTNLDTLFPNLTYNLLICEKKYGSKMS